MSTIFFQQVMLCTPSEDYKFKAECSVKAVQGHSCVSIPIDGNDIASIYGRAKGRQIN